MIPREYRIPMIGLILAGILWMTSLYQMEIVDRNAAAQIFTFDMPYYLFSPMNLWVARDIFYLVNALSFVLAVYSGAVFNGKRMERKILERIKVEVR